MQEVQLSSRCLRSEEVRRSVWPRRLRYQGHWEECRPNSVWIRGEWKFGRAQLGICWASVQWSEIYMNAIFSNFVLCSLWCYFFRASKKLDHFWSGSVCFFLNYLSFLFTFFSPFLIFSLISIFIFSSRYLCIYVHRCAKYYFFQFVFLWSQSVQDLSFVQKMV